MRRTIGLLLSLLFACVTALPAAAQDFVLGAKNFTENRLLAEIVRQYLEATTDLEVELRDSLGGTQICWQAMQAGEIDAYVEYSGTAWAIVLKETGRVRDPLRAFLHVQQQYRLLYDVEWLAPFGLDNTYALALRRELAEELGITRISQLAGLGSRVRAGFSIEFSNREDGWAGLIEHYEGLDLEPRSMEHGLAYEALAQGEIDLIDAYSTDGKLLRYDVRVLEDDLAFFPPYHAATLVRSQALEQHPQIRERIADLAFRIDDDRAIELNHRIEVGGQEFEDVARAFLAEEGLLEPTDEGEAPNRRGGWLELLWRDRTKLLGWLGEHLLMVAVALTLAALLAIPLGLWISRHAWLRGIFLGGASILQTVPSLALLAFLIAIPGLGLGLTSAIVALVLYAVLPILRNTVAGLDSVDPDLIDAARGLGLTPRQVLLKVQLPLALRTILAGLRTAAVISVGVGTLAAFIGAGGLGQPIVEGLYLNDTALILLGAVPSALLALAVDAGLGRLQVALTPRALR